MDAPTKLARAIQRLGEEAAAWGEVVRYVEEFTDAVSPRALRNTARRRAASLRDFAAELAADTSGEQPAEPSPESEIERARRLVG